MNEKNTLEPFKLCCNVRKINGCYYAHLPQSFINAYKNSFRYENISLTVIPTEISNDNNTVTLYLEKTFTKLNKIANKIGSLEIFN